MLELRGASALSSFRQTKLLGKLQAELSKVHSVSAEFVHFAELSAALSEAEQKVLERILQYGPKAIFTI